MFQRNNNIFEYLKGKGRGISHQGRVAFVGKVGLDSHSSLDLTTTTNSLDLTANTIDSNQN